MNVESACHALTHTQFFTATYDCDSVDQNVDLSNPCQIERRVTRNLCHRDRWRDKPYFTLSYMFSYSFISLSLSQPYLPINTHTHTHTPVSYTHLTLPTNREV